MLNFSTILKISRPKFWVYLCGTFLVGFTFGVKSYQEFLSFNFWVWFIYWTLPANLFIYGINDLFDRDTDAKNPKKNLLEHRLKDDEFKLIKFLSYFSILLISLPLFFSFSLIALYWTLLFVFLGYFYSANPLRFKSIPILDSVSNFLYAIPGLIGYSLVTGNIPSYEVIIVSLSWTAAMHLFSAIPDIEFDRQAGIKTSAVWLGKNLSLITCFLLWGYFNLYFLITNIYVGITLSIYPILPFVLLINKKLKIEKVYWYYPYINFFVGMAAFFFALFSK